MSTTLLYALIMAVAQIAVTLISYFLGYQTDHISSGRWFQMSVPLLVSIVLLFLGIKAVREEQPGSGLSFGKGVGTGALITFYSSVIVSIYAFIHVSYVNPNLADYAIEAAQSDWATQGWTAAKIEGAEKFTRLICKPTVQAILSFVFGNIFGVILSLIIAAFMKRQPIENRSISS